MQVWVLREVGTALLLSALVALVRLKQTEELNRPASKPDSETGQRWAKTNCPALEPIAEESSAVFPLGRAPGWYGCVESWFYL